jgi:hypothetical protein
VTAAAERQKLIRTVPREGVRLWTLGELDGNDVCSEFNGHRRPRWLNRAGGRVGHADQKALEMRFILSRKVPARLAGREEPNMPVD